VKCPVCGSGAEQFVCLDPETVEAMVAEEGGAEAEETFDGLKLHWTLDAKEELRRIPVAYMRRRAKARIEKTARVRTLSTITRDFVLPIVAESLVEVEAIGAAPSRHHGETATDHAMSIEAQPATQPPADEVTRVGDFDWTPPAVNRLNRVPEGFMRDLTRSKIEEYALERRLTVITLETAEQGIEVGRQMMAEMIAGYAQAKQGDHGNPHHQGTPSAVNPSKTSALNEIPSAPGNHP
jgi:hypothetical protein